MKKTFNEDGTISLNMTEEEYFGSIFSGKTSDMEIKPAPKPEETDLVLEVTDILTGLDIPRNIKGFNFLREAIILSVNDQEIIQHITKELYPAIAAKFNTLPPRAERAMRHAIEVACSRNIKQMEKVFGRVMSVLSDKPTNSEFIATIADTLRLRRKIS